MALCCMQRGVCKLVRYGCRVNNRNSQGKTALFMAVETGKLQVGVARQLGVPLPTSLGAV